MNIGAVLGGPLLGNGEGDAPELPLHDAPDRVHVPPQESERGDEGGFGVQGESRGSLERSLRGHSGDLGMMGRQPGGHGRYGNSDPPRYSDE